MTRAATAVGLTLMVALAACDRQTPTMVDGEAQPELARTPEQARIGINVLLDRTATEGVLAELADHGRITGRMDAIDAVFLMARRSDLATIRDLPFVRAANPDRKRVAGPPVSPVAAADFAEGIGTWNLDAADVTDLGAGRTTDFDGSGVWIGVLDTGFLDAWRTYFPEERIAVEHARSFGGGGARGAGAEPRQPKKWEHDVISHGTHVTSTILGYSLDGVPVNGVAPKAKVIPVKVLNNNGAGWSSVIARGIMHIADLKADALADSPVLINMSLGGPTLDAVEQAAIDHALEQGVIVVAAAGNQGVEGMSFPGAYEPVISAGASGWTGEWSPVGNPSWWLNQDVEEGPDPGDFYVTGFSARERAGQDLDVLAPGSWVVGPWQVDRGHTSYFFVGGTSVASPHVAGIVALMAQKDPDLAAADAEEILESTAVPLPPGSRSVLTPAGTPEIFTWGADASGSGLVAVDEALAATP